MDDLSIANLQNKIACYAIHDSKECRVRNVFKILRNGVATGECKEGGGEGVGYWGV